VQGLIGLIFEPAGVSLKAIAMAIFARIVLEGALFVLIATAIADLSASENLDPRSYGPLMGRGRICGHPCSVEPFPVFAITR
jgi:hypothetical protein